MEGVEKRLFVAGEPEPVVAWVPPGHFVLLDEMGAGWVRVWDPDGNGPGQPSVKR